MKKSYKVKGMHCGSCEIMVARNFKHIPGVKEVHVDHKTGLAKVDFETEPTLTDLNAAVKSAGYSVSNWTQRDEQVIATEHSKPNYEEIGAIFLVLVGIYLFFKQFNLLPDVAVSDSMTFGVVFIIGLVAAMSTCIATTGGLLIGIAEKYNEHRGTTAGYKRFKPHIYFNIGRILSYVILGGLLGYLGSFITISTRATGIFTVLISFIMVMLGLQLLNILPAKYGIHLPKRWTHALYDSGSTSQKKAPFLFGAFTFFLPCGFTQALQLYVITKGSFVIGATTMLAFSLGTLPALISLGAVSTFAKGVFKHYVTKIAGVMIVMIGILSISNGFALTGYSLNPFSDAGENSNAVPVVNGVQVIEMKVSGLDYYPSEFTIKKGVPVEWRIDGKQAQGCAGVIAIPKMGVIERLSKSSVTTITFTAEQTGKLKFTCGMGMAGPGTFTVV